MRAGALSGLRELAAQLAQVPEPLLLRCGMPLAMLDDPDLRIPYASACRLLEECAQEWHCPDFGLRLGQSQQIDVLGPIGLVARLTDTVGDALVALCDHMNAHATGFTMSLGVKGVDNQGTAVVTYTPNPRGGARRQKLELAMAAVRNVIAMISGQPAFAPIAVNFACPEPSDSASAKAFFRCAVRYGEAETTLRFDPAMLKQPTAIRDRAIEPLVRSYMVGLHDQLGEDVAAATRSLIATLLPSGLCTREAVAECLNLHPRTLQRRLEAQGTSFSQLLDEYRRELAMDLLGRGTMRLVQVADALGYADQSVFNQAFRRWTNATPSEYRN